MITKQQIIDDLKRVALNINKRIPSRADYKTHGKYSTRTVETRFIRWSNVLLEAFGETRLQNTYSKTTEKCKQCKKEYLRSKCDRLNKTHEFCSRSCAATYNNAQRYTIIEFYCKLCNKKVSKYSTLCKNCSIILKNNKFKNTTILEIEQRHSGANRYQSIRLDARNVMIDEPKVCQKCGYNKHVEVCHIKDISAFSKNSTILEVNDRLNLIHLCPNCHWEFDNLDSHTEDYII